MQGVHEEGAQSAEQMETAFAQPQVSSNQQQEAAVQRSMREHVAGQLMQHEWMTDIPEDLGLNWCTCSQSLDFMDPLFTSPYGLTPLKACTCQSSCCSMQACPASSRRSALSGHSVQKPHGELFQEGRDSASLPFPTSWRVSTDGLAPSQQVARPAQIAPGLSVS